jgi:site-specific DNA recombinase
MNGNGSQNKRNNGRRSRREAPTAIRCAIYTRKSTEEGLDSDFSSLMAQYEAAEAYIASQKQEGWVCLPDRYDDGGFTGGNMDRPALQRLLTDVKSGKIDCVVVYKLDRLSRSLIDFVRIIDVLENHDACFVSITQQFNSATSMGRLTLNILLSFAQFEREIIAERTRDKMCAARRRGKFTGGYPVLGYDIDPNGGKLMVNREEAERGRDIFRLYLQHQSLLSVVQELNARDWQTKSWVKRDGKRKLGKPFTKTNIHSLLNNVTYLGKVKHQDNVYDGEHEAIVDESLWNRVQQLLKINRRTAECTRGNKHGVLLQGLVCCAHSLTAIAPCFILLPKRETGGIAIMFVPAPRSEVMKPAPPGPFRRRSWKNSWWNGSVKSVKTR